MRVSRILLTGVLILLPLLSGCGPGVSDEDLGTVLYETPKVTGADEPYEMPELGPPLPPEDDPLGLP